MSLSPTCCLCFFPSFFFFLGFLQNHYCLQYKKCPKFNVSLELFLPEWSILNDTLVTMILPQKPFCYGQIRSYLMTTYSCSPSGVRWSGRLWKLVERKSTLLIFQMLFAFGILTVSVMNKSEQNPVWGVCGLWVFWNEGNRSSQQTTVSVLGP